MVELPVGRHDGQEVFLGIMLEHDAIAARFDEVSSDVIPDPYFFEAEEEVVDHHSQLYIPGMVVSTFDLSLPTQVQAKTRTKRKLQKRECPLLNEDMLLIKRQLPAPQTAGSLLGRRICDRARHFLAVTAVDDMFLEPPSGLEHLRAGPAAVVEPFILVVHGRGAQAAESACDLQHVVDTICWESPFTHEPCQVGAETGLVSVSFLAEGTDLGFPGHLGGARGESRVVERCRDH